MCRKLGKKHPDYTNRANNKRDKDGKILRDHAGRPITRSYGYNSLDAWTDLRDKQEGGPKQWVGDTKRRPSKERTLQQKWKRRAGVQGGWTNWKDHNLHFLRNNYLPGDLRSPRLAYDMSKVYTAQAAGWSLDKVMQLGLNAQAIQVGYPRGFPTDINSNVFVVAEDSDTLSPERQALIYAIDEQVFKDPSIPSQGN